MQFVSISGAESELGSVNYGVPQGSPLCYKSIMPTSFC